MLLPHTCTYSLCVTKNNNWEPVEQNNSQYNWLIADFYSGICWSLLVIISRSINSNNGTFSNAIKITAQIYWHQSSGERAKHFSNWCDICKVAKVVHGNRSDTWPSILLLEVYQQTTSFLPCLKNIEAHKHALSLSLTVLCLENRSNKITASISDRLLILFPVYADLIQQNAG